MKKTIFRLSFLLTILSTLWCCRNEEFSTEDSSRQRSYNSSARFASKSFWKEDEVYIHKVQQVFMKVANMEHVKSRYGDLYWDYAMTFGQFGESYLLAPVVKDNRVVLLMEAVREGNKVYFFEKEDKKMVDFFHAVIFSNITDYGEKTDSQTSTSSRNTPVFQCSTRWITIGCTDKEPSCTPYTTSETICKWIPGTTPKTFDPIGMDDGGGGGNGYEYPDPPEEELPCVNTKNMLLNTSVQNKLETLKEKTKADGNEFGFKVRPDGTTSEMTEGGKQHWDVGSLQGFNGFYHSHPGQGINIFSPPDIQSLFTNIITSGTSSTVSNVFIGVIGSENCSSCPGGVKYFHYVVRYNGPIQDAGTISSTNYDMKTIINNYQKRENELASILPTSPYSDNDGASLNHKGVEKLFFDTLDKMNINKNNMILQRIDENGSVNTITLNSDGTIKPVPCP